MKRFGIVGTWQAAIALISIYAWAVSSATAQDIAAGQRLAEELCSRCHAIGPDGASPNPAAPPFRDVAKRYSVWGLQEALAEGIVTGHPEMPEFTLTPEQISNLLGYMDTFSRGG